MPGKPDTSQDSNTADLARYRRLIEHTSDAVVEFEFVEGDPVIRDVNDSFVETFGYDRHRLCGSSLNERIVPEWKCEEASQIDRQTATGDVTAQQVTRQTADGLKQFLHRSVPCPDDGTRIDGIAIYTDLTEVTQQRKQLQVLNRVLRHNLRNQATIILGHTTRLLTEFDEQASERADAAATVEAAAEKLESLLDEASKINEILDTEPDSDRVDGSWLLQQVVQDAQRRHPAAVVQADLPESVFVKADGRLRFAFESLVQNAIEHNPAPEPQVRVDIDHACPGAWVDICVDDDGPLIPTDERDIITDDSEITPTHHGTGLGPWIAKWTAELYGGELLIQRSDLGGNSVCIRLLAATDD